MAERIRRTKKYNNIVEIGNAAKENLERMKRGHIIKFFPEHMPDEMFYPKHTSEAAHFCVVCGKHGEYRMSEHLQRAHKDVLPKESIEFKIVEQLGRGITQYMGVARIDLRLVRKPMTYGELCIYRDLTRQIKNYGIPIVGEYKGQINRDRYVTRSEMNVEIQELQERFKVSTEEERELEKERSAINVVEASAVLEKQVEVVEPSTSQATPSEAFTPTPQRHQLYTRFGDKAYTGGSHVAEVFKAPPNLDLMFSYELDEQAPNYYVEEYTVPVKYKHKWQGNVDAGMKYYRKLDGRAHPLLKDFEEYISEALPDASARKGNPLKNGTWGYISCINRFMLVAMRARKRINETVTIDDAIYSCDIVHAYMRRLKAEGVTVGCRKSIIKALIAFSKFIEQGLEARAGRERVEVLERGRKNFLNYIAKLNVEEKRVLSYQDIVPSEKQKGELYCVARAVVEHKGVEESIEKLMKIFERKGTLQPAQYNYIMGALWCYIIHCNTSRNECIYKMVYGSVYPSEQEEAIPAGERTGLQPFSLRYGDGEGEEILWIGSYPVPKSGAKAAQYKQPFYGQYFVLDAKSKKWMTYYTKLRDFVIAKKKLQGMKEPLAPFFLQYGGARVHQMTVPHVMKQFLRDSGFGDINLSCNVSRHAIADLQYDDAFERRLNKLLGADKYCAMLTGHTQEMQAISYVRHNKQSCAYGYIKVRLLGKEEAARNRERVREVKKMFKLANLERRKHLSALEEENLALDDYEEVQADKNLSEEGRGEENDDDEEEEDDRDDENEENDENDSAVPFSRSDMLRRRLQPRAEAEGSPRKRPRVLSVAKAGTTEGLSSTLEEIVMEQDDIGALKTQPSLRLPLKQFEQHPTSGNDDGKPVQHIIIDDEEEAIERIREYKLKFHFKRRKSEACAANAELVLSDSIPIAVRKTVHVVRKRADFASLAILEQRFEPLDPSLHLQLLNNTPYTGGLTKVDTVLQQNSFLRRCHAQPVQDFPWLEVREMPTIKGRGVFAKVDIAKGMAVADYRGYRGLAEDVKKPYNKELDKEQRHKVAKYWMGVAGSNCSYIVLAHCDSYKATVTLGRLINQSVEHANLNLQCIHLGERRVRWLHCLIANRNILAGEQLLWNYGIRERNPSRPSFPDNFPCICHVCDPAAEKGEYSVIYFFHLLFLYAPNPYSFVFISQSARRSIHVPRVWNFERSLSEENLNLHEKPEFDVGELLFLVTQKASAVGLLLESTPTDPRVAFARSRRTVFTKNNVFPDPEMFLVKVASPLAQLLHISTEVAFKHMESVVLILYRNRNDSKPLVILLGARHLEESGHRYGCCVAVVGDEIYAVERQMEARADEVPLHLELLEAGPLTRHFPLPTVEPWNTIGRKPKLTHQQIIQLLQDE